MEISKIAEYARALYDAHGDKAEAEAERRAKKAQEAGDEEHAAIWREVRSAISGIRGAHES